MKYSMELVNRIEKMLTDKLAQADEKGKIEMDAEEIVRLSLFVDFTRHLVQVLDEE